MKIIRTNVVSKTNAFPFNEMVYNEKNEMAFLENLIPSKYNIYKTFKTNECIVYNTITGSVVLLNQEENALFKTITDRILLTSLDLTLYSLGFLVQRQRTESSLLRLQNAYTLMNSFGLSSVTILPTQVCNARCEYCFAEHNDKIFMDENTIDGVISFFERSFSRKDKVLLRWFGGEPLLAQNVIDRIITGIDSSFDGILDFESLLFTNGSLITEDLINNHFFKWRVKKVQLTIDGYREEHNNRKNYSLSGLDYYSKVISDIKLLLDYNIAVDCRVNLDKKNIMQIDSILNDLVQFKNHKSFRVRLTVLRPSDCGYNGFDYITTDDLKWAYNLIFERLLEFGFLSDISSLFPKPRKEICIAKSINKIIIGADGGLYKCIQKAFNSDYSVGSVFNGLNYEKFLNDYCLKDVHTECEQCKFYPVCMGGCDAYWEYNFSHEISPCIREKHYMDLVFEYAYQMIKSNPLELERETYE